MLWIVGVLVVSSIAAVHAAWRRRRGDVVFVGPTEPISVVHLRFLDRTVQASALREASQMLSCLRC